MWWVLDVMNALLNERRGNTTSLLDPIKWTVKWNCWTYEYDEWKTRRLIHESTHRNELSTTTKTKSSKSERPRTRQNFEFKCKTCCDMNQSNNIKMSVFRIITTKHLYSTHVASPLKQNDLSTDCGLWMNSKRNGSTLTKYNKNNNSCFGSLIFLVSFVAFFV